MVKAKKSLIKKGDTVIIIAGKDKGKTGQVTKVLLEKNRVVVSGINMIKKHEKPNPKNEQGGIVEKEAALHRSNVMLYSSKQNKGVRVGVKMNDSKKVRVHHKTGEEF